MLLVHVLPLPVLRQGKVKVLVARLFVTPGTIDCQAPLSMYSPGKNTGVGGHALFQGIFLTQGSNPRLLHCRQIRYDLSHQMEADSDCSKTNESFLKKYTLK